MKSTQLGLGTGICRKLSSLGLGVGVRAAVAVRRAPSPHSISFKSVSCFRSSFQFSPQDTTWYTIQSS